MTRRKPATKDLLEAIIGEAEVALRRANFAPNVGHIDRAADIIQARIRRFRDSQSWSLIEELMHQAEEGWPAAEAKEAPCRRLMLNSKGGEKMTEKPKPKKEFRAGSVRASIWEHKRARDGEEFVTQSVTVERRCKDSAANEWRSTSSFDVRDLPNVAVVAKKAYEFLVLKERDPSKE